MNDGLRGARRDSLVTLRDVPGERCGFTRRERTMRCRYPSSRGVSTCVETARLPVFGGGAAGTRRRKKAAVVAKRASVARNLRRATPQEPIFQNFFFWKDEEVWLARSDGTCRRRAACARWAPFVEGGAMNRNRRANAGPVATTGNGTYGQFYQRDASGAYPGDLRTMGVGGVPGRRVPPFTGASPGGASASTAPGRGQPFAATNARVTAPTGTSARTRRANPNRSRRTPPGDPRVGRVAQRSGFDTHHSSHSVSSAERTPTTDFSKHRRAQRDGAAGQTRRRVHRAHLARRPGRCPAGVILPSGAVDD